MHTIRKKEIIPVTQFWSRERRKLHFRESNFTNFPRGGGWTQTPLGVHASGTQRWCHWCEQCTSASWTTASGTNSKGCWKPWCYAQLGAPGLPLKARLACENIRFSLLFVAGDVWRGGMSATQRQKFHTDDTNQCLHNKSGSHGVRSINLSNFMCPLVDFGKVLCSSAKELQQNSNTSSREDYIPQILTVLSKILHIYIWPLWPFACQDCHS